MGLFMTILLVIPQYYAATSMQFMLKVTKCTVLFTRSPFAINLPHVKMFDSGWSRAIDQSSCYTYSSTSSPQVISAILASGVSVAPLMNILPQPMPSLGYKQRQISEILSSAEGTSNSIPSTSSLPSSLVISANLASGVSVAPLVNILPPPDPLLGYTANTEPENVNLMDLSDSQLLDLINYLKASPSRTSD